MSSRYPATWIAVGCAATWALASCGRPPDYAACDEPEDCVAPDGATAACLDGSGFGFCTWSCADDTDCAADEVARACASFESEEGQHCFPTCVGDGDVCPDGLSCRSTGGGSDNERVCFPSGADPRVEP